MSDLFWLYLLFAQFVSITLTTLFLKLWRISDIFVLSTIVLLINGDLFLLKHPCNQTLFIKLRYVDIYGSRLWPSSNRIPCHGQLKTILLHFMKTNYKSIVITQARRLGLKLWISSYKTLSWPLSCSLMLARSYLLICFNCNYVFFRDGRAIKLRTTVISPFSSVD